VCGLSANGSVQLSSQNGKVQIATSTIGTAGSVQVRGGTANSAIADVVGPGGITADNTVGYAIVPTQETLGLHPTWPVMVANSSPYIKNSPVSTSNLTSIVGNTWQFQSALGSSMAQLATNWFRKRHAVHGSPLDG